MGKVLQRAGGGKVTVEGLAAENVKSSVAVTVRQGSKVVQQVTGSYKQTLKAVSVGSITNNAHTINIASILPDVYSTLTTSNFAFASHGASLVVHGTATGNQTSNTVSLSYNANTGILSVTAGFKADYANSNQVAMQLYNSGSIVCYYVGA